MHRLTLALITALPLPALAEGGILSVQCEVLGACESTGASIRNCDEITFDFAPVDVGPDGAGLFSVSIGADTWPATQLSAEGPFVWSAAPGHVAALLLPTGQTVFTLHEYDATIDPATGEPAAPNTTYLTCGVT